MVSPTTFIFDRFHRLFSNRLSFYIDGNLHEALRQKSSLFVFDKISYLIRDARLWHYLVQRDEHEISCRGEAKRWNLRINFPNFRIIQRRKTRSSRGENVNFACDKTAHIRIIRTERKREMFTVIVSICILQISLQWDSLAIKKYTTTDETQFYSGDNKCMCVHA